MQEGQFNTRVIQAEPSKRETGLKELRRQNRVLPSSEEDFIHCF